MESSICLWTYDNMFVNLQSSRFPIPFPNITSAEQHLIKRLDESRRTGTHLIGEAKLSDRQTAIILSYLITLLLRSPEEDSPKAFFYLCRGQVRRRQLMALAEEVLAFVLRSLAADHRARVFSLEQQVLPESRVMVRFYLGRGEEEKAHEQAFQHCKANGLLFKRIYFLRDQKYLQFRLRRREDVVWKKAFEFGCESDGSSELPAYLGKRADFLLIETNDMEGLLYEMLTVELKEVHLHRAFLEFRKLNRFYNFRPEERKVPNKPKHGSRKDLDQKRDEPKRDKDDAKQKDQQQNEDEMPSVQIASRANNPQQGDKMHIQLSEADQQPQIQWNVSNSDKKFNQLYKQKKELLMTAKVGYIPTTSVPPEYEECYYLMNLQIVGYMLSFLLLQWRQNPFQESHDTLSGYLNYVYSKTFLPSGYLRKLRRIFLSFLRRHPPILRGEQLSYTYIDQVLLFFEKAVIWNEIFCKPAAIGSTAYSQNGEGPLNGADVNINRFMVFREKVNKDSNLKLISFDQRILLQLLSQSTKNFSILQNLALSFEYYEGVFQPEKVTQKVKDFKLDYQCPKLVGQFGRHTLNGFIVSSTPNEEDLRLSSDQKQSSSSDLLQDRKIDKDHYNQIVRAYGVLVHDICELTPDGVVVYFPSRALLRECRAEWESKENIYEKINQIKRIYEEEEWEVDNMKAVHDFKRRCQLGRGGVFFIATESEFAQFQTFYGYYSKSIIFLGVPSNPFPIQTDQKIKFLKLKEQHHFEQALKNVCRCLSNCINSVDQMKTVVFADIAYNRTDLQKKWFPFIQEGNLNTLQVLDWISDINKRSSVALRQQREEEKRRKVEQAQRKQEDRLDMIRRNSVTKVQ